MWGCSWCTKKERSPFHSISPVFTQTVPSVGQDFWYSLMQVRAFQSLKASRHPWNYKNPIFSPSQPWTRRNLGERERPSKVFGKDLWIHPIYRYLQCTSPTLRSSANSQVPAGPQETKSKIIDYDTEMMRNEQEKWSPKHHEHSQNTSSWEIRGGPSGRTGYLPDSSRISTIWPVKAGKRFWGLRVHCASYIEKRRRIWGWVTKHKGDLYV